MSKPQVTKQSRGALRQAAFKQAMVEQGFVQCNVWVPLAAVPEIQQAAEAMRARPNLVLGPLVDRDTGRLVSLRHATPARK